MPTCTVKHAKVDAAADQDRHDKGGNDEPVFGANVLDDFETCVHPQTHEEKGQNCKGVDDGINGRGSVGLAPCRRPGAGRWLHLRPLSR